MKKLFDARGIEIPFPQRTISLSNLKRGGAVPLQLHIDNLETVTMGRGDHGLATRYQDTAETR
jgi:hypothetical protein